MNFLWMSEISMNPVELELKHLLKAARNYAFT